MIGIYKITNLINKKCYIGQSWNIEKRFLGHKRREHNNHLKRSFLKYGIENFSFEVIKKLENTKLTQILLNSFEIFYINQFDSTNPLKGYNKRLGGNSGGKFSEESRLKMSKSQTGKKQSKETIEKKRNNALGTKNPFYGKKHSEKTKKIISEKGKNRIISEETRLKMSQSQIGKHKGKKHSKETKEKLSKSHIGLHHTEETKQKIGNAFRGKTLSEEHKKKLSESKKGKNNPMYQKNFSEEHRKNLSKSRIGRTYSEESKRKMSEARKKYWKKKHESIIEENV